MHQPGIAQACGNSSARDERHRKEPGPKPWEGSILPLDYWCYTTPFWAILTSTYMYYWDNFFLSHFLTPKCFSYHYIIDNGIGKMSVLRRRQMHRSFGFSPGLKGRNWWKGLPEAMCT